MRTKLAEINKKRSTFTAKFIRYGTKSAYRGLQIQTLLFVEVKDEGGEIVTDHIWFIRTKGFDKYALAENDIVRFDARVKEYYKGYKGYREDVYNPIEKDYKLSHPTNIIRINNAPSESTNQLKITL